MPTHARMIKAVFKRNFFAYFINPTGYVFITVFILLGAMLAFWQPSFFMNNLANLDGLNAYFPMLLLFFVPALTMNVWSEERREGTDELLFTLPAHDIDVVLGKYLAVLGIYTVAVVFSLSHVIILAWLGEPDFGLMAVTYFGYWLAGAGLLAVGMVASLLTRNATVAFILGAVFCGVLVLLESLVGSVFSGTFADLVATIGIVPNFRPFGDGVVPLNGVFYFVALAAVMLHVNVVLVGRRYFGGGQGAALQAGHLLLRTVAIAVIAISIGVFAGRSGAYMDGTAEDLHTLQPQTRVLIEAIDRDRPVFIQAFISPEVPQSLVRTRKNLVNLLQRFDDIGGDRIRLAIHETEPFTEIAAHAADSYNIIPRKVLDQEASRRSAVDVFLGLVFTSGPEEFIIPFLDRGLPVEYELARSIRVVGQTARRTLGVVTTDAKLFGGFDFRTMNRSPDWSFLAELRKQFDVVQVPALGPYPDDLDVLLAVLPSSLAQPELDAFSAAVLGGTPTVIFDDPLPMFNPQLSPRLAKDAGRNPFQNQGQPPAPPKGNFDALLASLGLSWNNSGVVWGGNNPHPSIADVAPEIVFVTESLDNDQPFNPDSVIASGLQELVAVYAGALEADRDVPGAQLTWTPLVATGTVSGETGWTTLIRQDFFGMQMNPNPRRIETARTYTIAMRVSGTIEAPPNAPSPAASVPIDVIVVSDVDIVAETFFNLRRQGYEDLNFDNVTFALNCIDVLAGDESFVALRKHRPRHRTLTRVEELNREYADSQRAQTEAAEVTAAEHLVEAQRRLDKRVAELRGRTDLDQQTQAIMVRNLEQVENRRLTVREAIVEQEKEQQIAAARAEMNTAIARIQRGIKWWAAIPPPIPTLILAIVLFAYRRSRERMGVPERQLVGTA